MHTIVEGRGGRVLAGVATLVLRLGNPRGDSGSAVDLDGNGGGVDPTPQILHRPLDRGLVVAHESRIGGIGHSNRGLGLFQHPKPQRGEILYRGGGYVASTIGNSDFTVELVIAVFLVTACGGSRNRSLVDSLGTVKAEVIGLTIQLELDTLNCHKITPRCKILRHTALPGTPFW